MQTLLITGATGFLGAHLIKKLCTDYKIVALCRNHSKLERLQKVLDKINLHNIDQKPLSFVFEKNKIDGIIHLACDYVRQHSQVSVAVKNNLNFGLEVLELAIKHQTKFFINSGTSLPRSLNLYSLSKAQFLDWLIFYSNQIQVINLKIEHMYGPEDSENKFLGWLIQQLLYFKEPIELTSGEQKRDFIFIDDVLSAFCVLLNKREQLKNFSEFGLGSGKALPVKNFVESLVSLIEKKTGLALTQRLQFGKKAYRKNEPMDLSVDVSDLVRLGWQPKVDLLTGLDKIIQGYL